jgi:hypothetical protein
MSVSKVFFTEYRSEIEAAENDTLIIPFRQYFVTAAGEVSVHS